ncbi:MAG: ribonuclease H-like domain-containing protein [Lachnospiraceae bacterium]|nr:ribonuclease H-like domain-containing protein [Lachnospiraceae bacterium]
MEKYTYKYKTSDFDCNLEELLSEDALLFDIECTGLSRDRCSVYLIGCGYRKKGEVTVELLFAPTPEDEADTLMAFLDMLGEYNSVITFNGESFDIPFIRDRAKKHGLDTGVMNNVSSLDLFKVAKKFSKYFNTPNCRQKTIEQYYGLFREDKYNGGQLIEIYMEYCKHPTKDALDTLLLHNHEDITGMLTVLNVLELKMLCRSDHFDVSCDISQPHEIMIRIPMALHQDIRISGEYYDIAIKNEGITVMLHPFMGELKHFYKNYRDYCYIPDEDLLIPRSLASTIDKSRLEKATKDNCCTRHTGTFLPMSDEKGHVFFDAGDALTFKKSCREKQLFVEIKCEDVSEGFLADYAGSLIKKI